MSLNPLHCGAVVASFRRFSLHVSKVDWVLIPFIAGQWSLRILPRILGCVGFMS